MQFPKFVPHPLARGGHAQTLAATFLPIRGSRYEATQHRVTLPDGDQLVLHDDQPADWQAGDAAALLVHGLCGCHLSNYMVRIAYKLKQAGVRAFRLDLRGCGAGIGLAKRPYNAGRSADALAAMQFIETLCPGSVCVPIGFSLGGNIVLKMLGELAGQLPQCITRAAAVNPVIDLAIGVDHLARWPQRLYDRYFTKQLNQHLLQFEQTVREECRLECEPQRSLRAFDDRYTAPLGGYRNADDYYFTASAKHVVANINVPILVLAAQDDPVLPVRMISEANWSDSVRVHISDHGGHVGYIAATRNGDPDRRWLDWRIVDWVSERSG